MVLGFSSKYMDPHSLNPHDILKQLLEAWLVKGWKAEKRLILGHHAFWLPNPYKSICQF
jgi:hypothetical protein